MKEYCVRYVDLPCTAKGVTVQDDTGFFNIYINSLLSCEEQEKALAHELSHIQREDFDDAKPIERIEPYRSYCPSPISPLPEKKEESPRTAKPLREEAIITCGQLLAFAVKMECRKARQPWRLDKSKVDIWADDR